MSPLAGRPYVKTSDADSCVGQSRRGDNRRGDPGRPAAAVSQMDPEPSQKPRLREQLVETLRVRHYSIRTEEPYVEWNRRFVLFHGNRPPAALGKREIEQFLTHLAVVGR